MKKSINIQHVQFGALIAVLLLSTVMLTTIGAVQAQNITSTVLPSQLPAQDSTSTPATSALDSSGSNDDSLSADANDNSNSNADETTSSSGSADDATNSEDSDSQQDTTSSDGDDGNADETTSSSGSADEVYL